MNDSRLRRIALFVGLLLAATTAVQASEPGPRVSAVAESPPTAQPDQQLETPEVEVTFDAHAFSMNRDGDRVAIAMQGERTAESPDGARYESDGYSLVVRRFSAGTTTMIEIDDPSAPQSYEFSFDLAPGWWLSADGSGGVAILDRRGNQVGQVAAPWAIDANGVSVPTHYELDGKVLVQKVDHIGAAHPVLADPSITLGSNVYVWYWGWEITWWGSVSAAYLAAYICAAYGSLHPVLCAVSAAGAFFLQTAFHSTFAGDGCRYVIAFRYWGWPNYMERLSGYGCTYRKYDIPG